MESRPLTAYSFHDVTAVDRERPDDEDIEGDHRQRPDGVVRQPSEVRDRAADRHDHAEGARPHLPGQNEKPASRTTAREQVDPSPCRGVELQDPVGFATKNSSSRMPTKPAIMWNEPTMIIINAANIVNPTAVPLRLL